MVLCARKTWLVQSISLSRLGAALVFCSLAFQNVPVTLLSCLYGLAMGSDLLDGFLARKLNAESYFGRVLDLVSDKSLTSVSLLYAAARGIHLFPLAMIATREIIMIGFRLVVVGGTQIFPTSRIVGGLMALLLWGNTLFLVLAAENGYLIQIADFVYWICSVIFVSNLVVRIYVSRHKLKASLE